MPPAITCEPTTFPSMRVLILGCATLFLGASPASVLADSRPPSIPDNVRAVAEDDRIRVGWEASYDDVGVVGYNVYRNGEYHVTVFGTGYLDSEVDPDRTYAYEITAYDKARNYTRGSEEASVTLGGDGSESGPGRDERATTAAPKPAAPARSNDMGTPAGPSAAVLGDGRIRLSWASAGDGVEGYNVYRDGRYVTTVRRTEWVDEDTRAGREYRYYLVAFSHDKRFSGKSEATGIRVETADREDRGTAEARVPPTARRVAARNEAPSRDGAPDGYTLVFSDEFRGRSIDDSKWRTRYRWGPDWIINDERQYYVDVQDEPGFGHSPFSLDGEYLTISASRTPARLRRSANSQRWLSGAMTTYGRFSMKYGYVEMRAKMPRGRGMWPAFWLLHERNTPRRPEIDVVELLGHDTDTVYQTYHWYQNHSLRSTPSFRVETTDYADDFHTYAVRWEPGRVTWYVDGRQTNRFDSDKVAAENMYLLLNLAVGGSWAGNPDGSTPDRVDYTIDYIRAYSR